MKDKLQKNNGRQPRIKWKTTYKNNFKKEDNLKKIKMEDDLNHNFKKSTLIGCDIISN